MGLCSLQPTSLSLSLSLCPSICTPPSSCCLYPPVIFLPPSPSSLLSLLPVMFGLLRLLPLPLLPPPPSLFHLISFILLSSHSPLQPRASVSSHHVLAATTGEPRPTETKALMKRVAIIFYRLLVVPSDVPNYLNAKLDLVPALWPLLTLIIHFCKKSSAPNTGKLTQIQNRCLGSNYTHAVVLLILSTRTVRCLQSSTSLQVCLLVVCG